MNNENNKMTAEQKAALSGDNLLAVVQQDWEEVRFYAAFKLTIQLGEYMLKAGYSEKQIAEQVLKLVDALIAGLQKKGGQDE